MAVISLLVFMFFDYCRILNRICLTAANLGLEKENEKKKTPNWAIVNDTGSNTLPTFSTIFKSLNGEGEALAVVSFGDLGGPNSFLSESVIFPVSVSK